MRVNGRDHLVPNHLARLRYPQHAGTANLAVGAANEWVLPFWNQHRSGLVLNFSQGVDYVALDDNDDAAALTALSYKTLYAFDENGTLVGQTAAMTNARFAIDLSDTCGARIHAVEFDTQAGAAGGAGDSACFTIDNLEVRGPPPGGTPAPQLEWYSGCHDRTPWAECELYTAPPYTHSAYDLYDGDNGVGPTGCSGLITTGGYTCAVHFCPTCPYVGYCNATCGHCFVPEALLDAPSFAASVTAGLENMDGTGGRDPASDRPATSAWNSPAPGAASQNAYLGLEVEGGVLGRHEAYRLRSDGNMSMAHGRISSEFVGSSDRPGYSRSAFDGDW